MRPYLAIFLLSLSGPSAGCSTVQSGMQTTRVAATKVHGAVVREEAPRSLDGVGRAETLGDAVMSPVKDLNLRKVEVPEAISRIFDPYAPVKNCDLIHIERAELDAVLGPDYDAEMSLEERELLEQAGLGLVSSGLGSLIPFRGVVREVTGASREERELREAFRKGVVRRGFLRGQSAARNCG